MNAPPQHIDAERSVLGAMLLNPDAIMKAIGILGESGDAFYVGEHSEIYISMVNLFRDRDPVDIITLSESLTSRGQLDKVGGAIYIAELTDAVPTSANVEYYAEIVLQKYLKRLTIQSCAKAQSACYDDDVPVREIANNLSLQAHSILNNRKSNKIEHVRDILPRVMAQIEAQRKTGSEMMGISTGLPALDKIMLGLRPETLNILAARPSVGKSGLAVNIMHNVALQGHPVLFYSLEMRSESLIKRMLAIATQTPYKTLSGTFQPEQQKYRLSQAQRQVGQTNIFVDDSGLLDINLFRASARKFAMDHEGKTPVFIIDYLTLVQFHQSKGKNRYEVIGDFTREVKLLANELRCPMLVLCQLSREADEKDDALACKPYMRESGNIEQDADTIMIALSKLPKWLENHHLPAGVEREDLINFGLAKNRDGEIGLCPLVFKKNTQTIRALADYAGEKYGAQDGLPIEDTYDEDDHGDF